MPKKRKKSAKQLHKKAWELARQVVFLRDGKKCALLGLYVPLKGHSEVIQVDHCFTRKAKMLYYDIRNLTALCDACHSSKSFQRAKAADKLVDQLVRHREGAAWWREAIGLSMKENPNFNRIWWLEETIEQLEEDIRYYKVRSE